MLHSETMPKQDVGAETRRVSKPEWSTASLKSPEVYRAQANSDTELRFNDKSDIRLFQYDIHGTA